MCNKEEERDSVGARVKRAAKEEGTLKDVLSSGKCAEFLKALAEPERLKLVQALRERAQSVSDLAALLDSEIGNVSHHLKILRQQGIVTNRRVGRTKIYSLSNQVFSAQDGKSDRLNLGCCCLEIPK